MVEEFQADSRSNRILFYNLAKNYVVEPILNRYFEIEVLGANRLVSLGSHILVTHHATFLDAPAVGVAFDRKVHGWIEETVFNQRKGLYSFLELIPVNVSRSYSREEIKSSIEKFNHSKSLSISYLKNTMDAIALTSDGLAEHCLDSEDNVLDLDKRENHSGPASLGYEAQVPVVPISVWIPEEHRQALLIAEGTKSLHYLEKHRKIPYLFYINEPIFPGEFKNKRTLQTEIRRRQIEGYELLKKR